MTKRKSQSTIIDHYQQLCFVPFHLGSPKAIARLVLGRAEAMVRPILPGKICQAPFDECDCKITTKNRKKQIDYRKLRKRLKNNSIKKSKKSPKMRFFSLVSIKGSFNICIFEKFFVPL